ncbi:MAG TPA: hypothetical protein VJQ44_11445 [Gemmatimonadales bacterium]|nr:hypothetical protein [Gemmatimonadales bacterium]
MSIPLAPILVAFGVLGSAHPGDVSRTVGEPCSAIDSVAVAQTMAFFDTLVTSQEPAQTSLRRSLDLSQMAQFTTHIVIDSITCQAARRAVSSHLPEPFERSRLWVYELGPNGYAVEAPDLAPPGRPSPLFLFDRHWRYENSLEP